MSGRCSNAVLFTFASTLSSVMLDMCVSLFPVMPPSDLNDPVRPDTVTFRTTDFGGGWPLRSKNWVQGLTSNTVPSCMTTSRTVMSWYVCGVSGRSFRCSSGMLPVTVHCSRTTSRTTVASLPHVRAAWPDLNVQPTMRTSSTGGLSLSSSANGPLVPLRAMQSSFTANVQSRIATCWQLSTSTASVLGGFWPVPAGTWTSIRSTTTFWQRYR